MIDQALFGLLHLLVFVYWLGGDLGAFYASRFLTGPGESASRRLLAAKIVGDVDMAPRTALILTMPTGLALAQARGWLSLGWLLVGIAWLLSLVWLLAAWQLHRRHGAAPFGLRAADRGFRYALLASALAFGAAGLLGAVPMPVFIAGKLIILAGCVALGLLIRRTLTPLPAALADLPHGNPGAEETLAEMLCAARPLVLAIWFLLLCAAFLGLWTPIDIGAIE